MLIKPPSLPIAIGTSPWGKWLKYNDIESLPLGGGIQGGG